MDLHLFGQVILRFRWIFAIGLVASILFATLVVVRVGVGSGGIHASYRQGQTYEANVLLSVTQPGFLWGQSALPERLSGAPGWLTYLANYYSQLARSDIVQRRLAAAGVEGVVTAAPVNDASGRDFLPFVNVVGTATSSGSAVRTARKGAKILIDYIREKQERAGIRADRRAVVSVVVDASSAVVTQPRKKTTPVFVFLATMMATLGVIVVLDNLRPRAVSAAKAYAPDVDKPRAVSAAKAPVPLRDTLGSAPADSS